MKTTVLLIICITLIGCVAPKPSKYDSNSQTFENRYKEFINEDETQIASWYHYVKTKTIDGDYIVRTFFPETKQITSEVMYLDKAIRIANGPAKYWHENGNLKSNGNLANSKMVGKWEFYHRKSGKISSKGNYNLGKKQGNWEQYDREGRLKEVLTYENDSREGKFIQYDSLNTITNEGIYKSDTIFQETRIVPKSSSTETKVVETMPYLSQCKGIEDSKSRNRCSTQALLEYVYGNLKYPSNARKLGLEGMTVNKFTIDKDGSVIDIDVVIGLCQEFKDSNMELLSNMPKWEPGMQRGKNVKVSYTLPIKYKLESKLTER